jgi:tRNA-dependent cyclodipeptide synthase
MPSAARYFVPVCLYPHTRYRTIAGVAALFQKYELRAHEYLIVVADRLLVLDRLVTGRHWTAGSAAAKARQEAEQVVSLIERTRSKAGARARGRIVYWDDVAETAQFSEFARRLRANVSADRMLAGAIDEFAECRVRRFGLGSAPDRELDYEREYLLSEVCMSVFCTEVLGFWVEVWERAPAADVPDPLKLLYDQRPELVGRLTGRRVTRVLSFLYSDGPGNVSDREHDPEKLQTFRTKSCDRTSGETRAEGPPVSGGPT